MAMSASGLADEIVAGFEAAYGALSGDARSETLRYYTKHLINMLTNK